MKKILMTILMLLLALSCSKKESEKIEILLDWTPNTNHTGMFVALDKGYFNDLGLNVSITQPPEGSTSRLVGSGKYPFGISFQDTLGKYEEIPVTALFAIIQHNTVGLLSPKEYNIHKISDLVGKKYGTWEDPIEQGMIKYITKNEGKNPDQIDFVPYYADIKAGFENKIIDAAYVFYGWDGISAKINNLDTNFLFIKDVDNTFDFYSPVFIGNDEYIKNNPEITKKVVKAIKKGYEYAAKNPEESAKILLKYSEGIDEKLVLESQKYLSTKYIDDASSFGIIDNDRWNNFYNWLKEVGIRDKEAKTPKYTMEFLND